PRIDSRLTVYRKNLKWTIIAMTVTLCYQRSGIPEPLPVLQWRSFKMRLSLYQPYSLIWRTYTFFEPKWNTNEKSNSG
ncbi:MAG: hypothetical protein ABIS01_13640, partial [Ferruginibacter sp.]